MECFIVDVNLVKLFTFTGQIEIIYKQAFSRTNKILQIYIKQFKLHKILEIIKNAYN